MRGMRLGLGKASRRFESRNLGSRLSSLFDLFHCFLFHFLLRIPCTLEIFITFFSYYSRGQAAFSRKVVYYEDRLFLDFSSAPSAS